CSGGMEGFRAAARPRLVVATRATISSAEVGRVRPPVTAYGRTTGPASSSGSSSSSRDTARPLHGCAYRRGENLAGAVDQSGHLEGDHTGIGGGAGGDGEAGAVADRRDEQVPAVHLDDGLTDVATVHVARRAERERAEPRGDGGDVVAALPGQRGRAGQLQAVRGQRHRPLDVGDTTFQVVQQEVEVTGGRHRQSFRCREPRTVPVLAGTQRGTTSPA